MPVLAQLTTLPAVSANLPAATLKSVPALVSAPDASDSSNQRPTLDLAKDSIALLPSVPVLKLLSLMLPIPPPPGCIALVIC